VKVPGETQAIGLLARCAPGAPDADPRVAPLHRRGGERGKHIARKAVEDVAVAPEPGDRDTAHGVEPPPFRGVRLQNGAIRRHVGEAEPTHASGHPLADGSAHLSEPDPSQTQPGQAPLKEGDAFLFSHLPAMLAARSGRIWAETA
jgi:hypothetical protein